MELIPFLRCVVGDSKILPSCVIAFKQADGKTASSIVNKDFIYDGRLCKVKIHLMKKDTAIIALPAPLIGKEESCMAEVSKNLLEYHR